MGSCKSLQRTFLGCREPEKWQHDGGVPLRWLWKWRKGAASRRWNGQRNNPPLEPPEGIQAVWSLILAQGVLGPSSILRAIRNKTQKQHKSMRQEDISFQGSYWCSQKTDSFPWEAGHDTGRQVGAERKSIWGNSTNVLLSWKWDEQNALRKVIKTTWRNQLPLLNLFQAKRKISGLNLVLEHFKSVCLSWTGANL